MLTSSLYHLFAAPIQPKAAGTDLAVYNPRSVLHLGAASAPVFGDQVSQARQSHILCTEKRCMHAHTRLREWRTVLPCRVAFLFLCTCDVMMQNIRRFESVIHEFDPYFNYRSTKYLAENGSFEFLNWCVNAFVCCVCVCRAY